MLETHVRRKWQRRPDAEPYRVQLRQNGCVGPSNATVLSGLSFVSQGEKN